MISASREEREAALRAVITDVLLDPEFNPLSISVSRVKVPDDTTEEVWREVGICEVHILAQVNADVPPLHYVDVTADDIPDFEEVDLDQVEENQ